MTKIRWHEGTASHMQIKENKGVTWLTYPAFEQFTDIVHGFSTRLGGVSEGIYASMNLSFTRGDEDAAVHENYRRFAAALGFSKCGSFVQLRIAKVKRNLVCSLNSTFFQKLEKENTTKSQA